MLLIPTTRDSFGCLLALALAVRTLSGCGASDATLGATPGGAQDDALANEKIANGEVPRPEDITVEGVLAAHDFPLDAVTCDRELCLNSAYAVAPCLELGKSAVFVQLGFDTGIDAATFRRAPLNLSVVVDRSGSMAGEKIVAVRSAVAKLVDQLDEADRLSIVLFDQSVEVLLKSTLVNDRTAIKSILPRIKEQGSTNMSLGLRAGYDQVAKYGGFEGVSDRVMVFTDAQVNTGDTDTSNFIALATENSEKNVGLTIFGVGIDLNQSLVLPISKLRGNSYFYLSDSTRIATVFDQDFDYLVTPLAYDLKLTLSPSADYRVSQVYGFAGNPVGSSSVDFAVPTVFLSRGHGAIVVRLEPRTTWPKGASPIANLSLSYLPPTSTEASSQGSARTYEGAEDLSDTTAFYSQLSVRRTVAFVNAAVGEKRACSLYYGGDASAAISTLDDTIAMVDREWTALEDQDLAEQADILAKLRQNINEVPDYYNQPSLKYGSSSSRDKSDSVPLIDCSAAAARSAPSRHLPLVFVGFGLFVAVSRRRLQNSMNLRQNRRKAVG